MRKSIAALFALVLLLSPHTHVLITDAQAATRAKGVIRNVDVEAKTVTLVVRRDGTNLVLQTDDQTRITRNGDPARLSDLQQGDTAVAVFDRETLLASRIDARGDERQQLARIEGTISAVDTAARTLTIVPLRDGRPVTLGVTDSTAITLDGRPARLDDLARGFTAGASYDPRSLAAVRVNAESFAEVRGVVRDVGVANHTLTIGLGGDRSLTLSVPDGTPISLNGRPADLEDLRRGFHVVASYVESSLTAVRIAATSLAEVTGNIRRVDTAAGIVVISPLIGGDAVELHVTEATRISVGGEPARLEELQPGMAAQAVFNIASHEAQSITARAQRR